MSEKSFEQFIESTELPSTAKEQLPGIISNQVKRRLLKHADAEAIIVAAIDEINRGSIESVEALILKKLNQS